MEDVLIDRMTKLHEELRSAKDTKPVLRRLVPIYEQLIPLIERDTVKGDQDLAASLKETLKEAKKELNEQAR